MGLLPSPSLTFSFNLACVSNNQLGGIRDLIITADNEEAFDMQVQTPTLSDPILLISSPFSASPCHLHIICISCG